MSTDAKISRNFLSLAQQVAMVESVKSIKVDLEAGKLDYAAVAKFLMDRHKVMVTVANVKSILEASGVAFKSRVTGGGVGTIYGKLVARIDALEARVTELEDARTRP